MPCFFYGENRGHGVHGDFSNVLYELQAWQENDLSFVRGHQKAVADAPRHADAELHDQREPDAIDAITCTDNDF